MLKQGIAWVFFDVGSTLVDETEAYNHRIRDVIRGTDISFEEFNEKRVYFARQNLKGDLEAMKYFGLEKTPWHKEDEVPYSDAEEILKYLCEKGYKLGVIANQSLGPAKALGMQTIWVRQGFAIYQNPKEAGCEPDYTVDNLRELKEIL